MCESDRELDPSLETALAGRDEPTGDELTDESVDEASHPQYLSSAVLAGDKYYLVVIAPTASKVYSYDESDEFLSACANFRKLGNCKIFAFYGQMLDLQWQSVLRVTAKCSDSEMDMSLDVKVTDV